MARPIKENASYFSHDADMRNNRKVKALRARFGLDGYAVWCMTLECLTDENGFVLSWDDLSIELISGDFGVSAERLMEISDYMSKVRLVIIENEKLHCPAHRARMQYVIDERERKRQWKHGKKEVSDGENQEGDGENAQTKLKEIKGKEIKGNEIKGNEMKGKEIKERGVGPQPARAENSSNDENPNPTTPPQASAFTQIRQAIQQWQDADNGEALRKIAADQKYLGQIEPEITRFITNNLGKDPYRERITRAPLDFFQEQFPGWLCLPAAQRASKAHANGSGQQSGSSTYTKPTQRDQQADQHRSRESAMQLIDNLYPGIADQFTEKHIQTIRTMASNRSATEMVHAMAKTIHNGPAPPRTNGNAHPVSTIGLNINGL